MIKKRTVFVLGAGASCPYGYPSGARLRDLICFDGGFHNHYLDYFNQNKLKENIQDIKWKEVNHFIKVFKNSNIKSIDVFMANNPMFAPIGKYIIAHEIFRYELNSRFGEDATKEQERLESLRKSPGNSNYLWGTPGFLGGDWYFYLYNKIVEGLVGKDALPDFSNSNISFITFNYDRSLEHFFYESLRNSFSEVSEEEIIKTLQQLKILHVYGQLALLKWQNPKDYIDYKQNINEAILERSAKNIRTIYEEKENPELLEAQDLLKQAEQIFFLGFGYAPENMEVLGLPELIHPLNCSVYGTAFGMFSEEIDKKRNLFIHKLNTDSNIFKRINIKDMDCLELLRRYFE
jgi:hypothetical protein